MNQRLLFPVHQWLMTNLGKIPMDGTFDQTRPLDRLVGKQHLWSFDLSAATDRWPLQILFEVLQVRPVLCISSQIVLSIKPV